MSLPTAANGPVIAAMNPMRNSSAGALAPAATRNAPASSIGLSLRTTFAIVALPLLPLSRFWLGPHVLAHIPSGEPVSTSPGYALRRRGCQLFFALSLGARHAAGA